MLALLAMGLPFNIGGWGPREAIIPVAFAAAGFGATQGLTAAVVYGVLSLIACLPGAGVLLLRRPGQQVPASSAGQLMSWPLRGSKRPPVPRGRPVADD